MRQGGMAGGGSVGKEKGSGKPICFFGLIVFGSHFLIFKFGEGLLLFFKSFVFVRLVFYRYYLWFFPSDFGLW